MRDDDPERLQSLDEMAAEDDWLDAVVPWHGLERPEIEPWRTDPMEAATLDWQIDDGTYVLSPDAPPEYWWPMDLTPRERERADAIAEFLATCPPHAPVVISNVALPYHFIVVGTTSEAGHFMAFDEVTQMLLWHAAREPRIVCQNTLRFAFEQPWYRKPGVRRFYWRIERAVDAVRLRLAGAR